MSKTFKESVSIPLVATIAYSIAMSLPIAAMLTWMALPFFSEYPPITIFIRVFLILWVFTAIALKWSKRSTIRITDTLQFSGKGAPTLTIRGGLDAQITYIPLASIEEVHPIEFEGPWWRLKISGIPQHTPSQTEEPTFWQKFFAVRTAGDEIPISDKTVTGYRGPGLLVTYRAKTLVSGGEDHLWRVLFPCQQTDDLKHSLEKD